MRLLSLSEASIQPRTSRLKLPNFEKSPGARPATGVDERRRRVRPPDKIEYEVAFHVRSQIRRHVHLRRPRAGPAVPQAAAAVCADLDCRDDERGERALDGVVGEARAAVVCAIAFFIGRILFFVGYRKAPEKRAFGFMIGMFASIALILGGVWGLISAL